MLKHSKIKKYAFVGTSSAGKTTATYQTCGFLKEHGIRVDGILQQDRRLPFDPALLDTHAEAQYWFISNIITAENYLALQRGVDCIVSDRSAVDFFAYAKTQWPNDLSQLQAFVLAWATTYDAIFYLPPREYDDDGVRPSDEFRLAVDKTLMTLIEPLHNFYNVSNWKEAAVYIAVATKKALLGNVRAHLTGSWFKGTQKPGSDFDFVMTSESFANIDPDFAATIIWSSPEAVVACREKHSDHGLIALGHSYVHNVGIQIQASEETLAARLSRNHE